jgi:hypothetical protein
VEDTQMLFLLKAVAIATASFAISTNVIAQEQVITAECTTRPTGGDGVRHGCSSKRSEIRAPEGHVFVQNSLQGGLTSGAGSQRDCRFAWDNYIEVIPGTGITQPATLYLSAHARGPKGHFAGRGWAHCRYTVKITRYTR